MFGEGDGEVAHEDGDVAGWGVGGAEAESAEEERCAEVVFG